MDPAGELAQLVQARLELRARGVEQRRELRVARRAPPRDPELRAERDHPRLRAVVQVALEPAPLVVAGAHEPRARRAQLLDPRPQLRGEALVLERERRRGARRADELGLVGERGIVLDRGDPAALQLDLGPPAGGQADGAPRRVDEPARSGQPVGHGDRRVAERLGERGPHGVAAGRLAEPGDQRRDPVRLGEPAAQQPGQEPERHGGEQQDRQRLERVDPGADGVEPGRHREHEERHARGPDHGREHAPLRLARGAPAAPHDREADRDHDQRAEELEQVEPVRQRLVGPDDEQVPRLARRVLLEQQRRDLQHGRGEVARGHDQPLRAGLQPPARIGEHEVPDDGREERVAREADRVERVPVRGAEALQEPREPGGDHQRAGPVRRPPPPGEQAGPGERPADHEPERRRDAALVRVVAREHERDGRERRPRRRRRPARSGPAGARAARRRP